MLYNKYQLRFNYKSGIQEDAWFYSYTLTKQDGVVTSLKYHTVNKQPLMLNVGVVESIWLLAGKRGILGDKK